VQNCGGNCNKGEKVMKSLGALIFSAALVLALGSAAMAQPKAGLELHGL